MWIQITPGAESGESDRIKQEKSFWRLDKITPVIAFESSLVLFYY